MRLLPPARRLLCTGAWMALVACGGRSALDDAVGTPDDASEASGGAAGRTASAGGTSGNAGSPSCWSAALPAEATPAGYEVPATSLQSCGFVGTWELGSTTPGLPAGPRSIGFDEGGRFVAGPVDQNGANLCAGFVRSGFYRGDEKLVGGGTPPPAGTIGVLYVETTRGSDVRSCELLPVGGSTAYYVVPLEGCRRLRVEVIRDRCTGGGIFGNVAILERRE